MAVGWIGDGLGGGDVAFETAEESGQAGATADGYYAEFSGGFHRGSVVNKDAGFTVLGR